MNYLWPTLRYLLMALFGSVLGFILILVAGSAIIYGMTGENGVSDGGTQLVLFVLLLPLPIAVFALLTDVRRIRTRGALQGFDFKWTAAAIGLAVTATLLAVIAFL